MNTAHECGKAGEQAVVDWLKQKKFCILATNYRTQLGEVDIIAQLKDLLVFVEVKTRLNPHFPLANVITNSKQRKIILATKQFILANKCIDKICRFDVALVTKTGNAYLVDYIESAFYGE